MLRRPGCLLRRINVLQLPLWNLCQSRSALEEFLQARICLFLAIMDGGRNCDAIYEGAYGLLP
jgi:hypothetical protein